MRDASLVQYCFCYWHNELLLNVTFAVMVLLEGPLRMSYNDLLLKRIRRKGIAFFISASSICFNILITFQRYEKADELAARKLNKT